MEAGFNSIPHPVIIPTGICGLISLIRRQTSQPESPGIPEMPQGQGQPFCEEETQENSNPHGDQNPFDCRMSHPKQGFVGLFKRDLDNNPPV